MAMHLWSASSLPLGWNGDASLECFFPSLEWRCIFRRCVGGHTCVHTSPIGIIAALGMEIVFLEGAPFIPSTPSHICKCASSSKRDCADGKSGRVFNVNFVNYIAEP
eukprot:NODE_14465_length_446_cov_35.578947_g14166_i0.p2 GENE.NODE_14465_length_446_cov_35.578947_g14166_i0~~NODE_14465_length_446_cov_35.578947_g14166_i0.p2  ORF type:complete len:107 (-),score=13.85 NODE_14465_length_446_cov_35.578947_g14166_i0:82-402(-)